MPKRQKQQYKRASKFDRPAFRSDMDRLSYALIPKAVCHPWARSIIDTLSPAANKVYSLLISLAMIGTRGYPGLAECDAYACRIVEKITDQKCGLSTWRNGRRELVQKGLASRTYWTRPDQRIQNGKRLVIVPGGQRVHLGGDQWCTKQIRITLLTPAGSGLFDRDTRNEKDEVIALLPTPLKSSARSQIEDSRTGNKLPDPASLDQTSSKHVSPQLTHTIRFDHEHKDKAKSSPSSTPDSGKEGKPTWPPCPATPDDVTIEHSHDEQKPAIEGTTSNSDLGGNKSFDESFSAGKGCSSERPTLPKGASKKGKTYGKAKLLNILHQCLNNYPTETADDLMSRCKTQMELSQISNWPTVINIPYWVDKSGKLTRRELVGYMRQRIIPGLQYSDLVVPREAKKYKTWTETPKPEHRTQIPVVELPDFLKNAAVRVGLE